MSQRLIGHSSHSSGSYNNAFFNLFFTLNSYIQHCLPLWWVLVQKFPTWMSQIRAEISSQKQSCFKYQVQVFSLSLRRISTARQLCSQWLCFHSPRVTSHRTSIFKHWFFQSFRHSLEYTQNKSLPTAQDYSRSHLYSVNLDASTNCEICVNRLLYYPNYWKG